ncbi:MAG: cysteine--tRNA ligase [Ignavibacteria bacterium]|nr:cysteine--tRNA ligase [Ignavibacteria bacterium]MDH7527267.1 cysteine--tRNA ligase [Ignavibacteria bacterium]
MRFYNTLTKKIEEFIPLEPGKVKIYMCGPTVYDYFHIGNARSFVMIDIIRRYFIYKGYEVKFVMNLTDIDDKIINKALSEGVTAQEIASKYSQAFFEDIKKLKIKPADVYPKATENIQYIIELTQKLIEKGFAYQIDGDVYYDVTKFSEYGKLSGKNLDELISGARVDVNEQKKNPADFALWKSAKPGEPYWDSPWGKGRPGWHIECSVMSMRNLGETFDIHAGGNDLIFPHHENEIAQSEAATGKPFARYWIHFGFLNIDNQKMSKSLGNFFTAREILEKYSPEALRLLYSQTIYSAPLNFSLDLLSNTENAVKRLENSLHLVRTAQLVESQEDFDVTRYYQAFEEAMDDNFNSPEAVAVIFDFVKEVNSFIAEKNGLSLSNKEKILSVFKNLAQDIFGIIDLEKGAKLDNKLIDDLMKIIIDIRSQLRAEKRFDLSDKIRDELKKLGIELEDKKGITTYKVNK